MKRRETAREREKRIADIYPANWIVVQSGCWEWAGSVHSAGYGVYSRCYVHRLAVISSGREIPSGLVVDHLCRNRICCNPDHLDVVTTRENTIRGEAPSKNRLLNLTKTHCARGHEFTPENTQGTRQRVCRACSIERQRIRRERIRAEERAA